MPPLLARGCGLTCASQQQPVVDATLQIEGTMNEAEHWFEKGLNEGEVEAGVACCKRSFC